MAPKVAQPGILLVDDEPFMLGLQSQMLRGMGYANVMAVSNAQEALSGLLSGERVADVIVCDLNMPVMDGVEFLQRLNASPFTGSVILLSAEGVRIMHTVQKLLAGGRLTIIGALQKPAQPGALRALLDSWAPRITGVEGAPRPAVTALALQTAIDEGQWLLHYQPKISLVTGRFVGVEALVRWQHPQHGLLFPADFIQFAEECGAIDALTEWVLREGCLQLAQWIAAGVGIHIAINVSMDNLRAPNFAPRVATLVRDAGVSPHDVTLEITESRAMSPLPAPLEALVRLRMQRFKLSIDDFGTGHSSLAQLRDVPFSELKIDRGFVHGARDNQIIRPMLEGSIGIAKRLGMLSVAEGVESENDIHLLREIECDIAQGYFIGRPMAAARLPEWIERWKDTRASVFGS